MDINMNMNHINQTIPIVKSNYKNHLNPIAPAPINLAPKPTPINLAPKPNHNGQISNDSSTITSLNSKNDGLNGSTNLETQSLPCVITSKQWVLPPRPKAGRKPSDKQKKQNQQNQQHNQQQQQSAPQQHQNNISSTSMKTSQSNSNVSKLSNNLTGLNLYKSKSDLHTQGELDSKSTTDLNLQNQLDCATEENQKLKNIISRLKQEIESLQTSSISSQQQSASSTMMNSPNIMPNNGTNSNGNHSNNLPFDSLSNLNSEVSTPINPSNFTSREVSPSTIDPTKIQQEHLVKRTKRQYRKKKPTKKEQAAAAAAAAAAAQAQAQAQAQQSAGSGSGSGASYQQPIQPKQSQDQTIKIKKEFSPIPLPFVKKEESPSPISLNLDYEVSSNLPNLESIITSPKPSNNMDHHVLNHKKPKTLKLERSMSLQPEHLDSGSSSNSGLQQPFKSIGLDRTMSIPMEFGVGSSVYGGGSTISRTTTNNTSLFDICEQCGNESCLCLESGHINSLGFESLDSTEEKLILTNNSNSTIHGNNGIGNGNDRNNSNNYNNNEYNNKNNDNEFDVNFFIKNEFDDDQFLMI